MYDILGKEFSVTCGQGWLEPHIHTIYTVYVRYFRQGVQRHVWSGLARTTHTPYTRCMYNIFGKEFPNYTVMYRIYTVLANPKKRPCLQKVAPHTQMNYTQMSCNLTTCTVAASKPHGRATFFSSCGSLKASGHIAFSKMTSLHPKKTSFPFQASHPCILQKLL